MNVLCFGDSIVEAGSVPEPDQWPTLLQEKLDAWRPGEYTVIKRGIPGATTSIGFDNMAFDVNPNMPAITLIEFGFNDCSVSDWTTYSRVSLYEYGRNLRAFNETVTMFGGRTIYIIPHTILPILVPLQGNGKTYNANMEPYRPMMEHVAKSIGSPFIDLPKMMKERNINLHDFLMPDKIHLSVYGNQEYADMVFDRMVEILA